MTLYDGAHYYISDITLCDMKEDTCMVTCALPVASCARTRDRMVPESTMPLDDSALL